MSDWQLSNLAVLDEWRAAQSDEDPLCRSVVEAIRGLRDRPNQQGEPGSRVSPLIRVLVVDDRVLVRYLVAEQFHTVRLLAITSVE